MSANMICSDCLFECYEVTRDEGIGRYEFWGEVGYHTDKSAGSSCCAAAIIEGACSCVRDSEHLAIKEHLDQDGRVAVKPGQRYRLRVFRGYAINDEGKRIGIKHILKQPVTRKREANLPAPSTTKQGIKK